MCDTILIQRQKLYYYLVLCFELLYVATVVSSKSFVDLVSVVISIHRNLQYIIASSVAVEQHFSIVKLASLAYTEETSKN